MEVLHQSEIEPTAKRRRLLAVHAHPDDEASKGAATVAAAAAAGHGTVLVTCTGGEQGEVLNPALDPCSDAQLAALRRCELTAAAQELGVHRVWLLGFADSGMAGSPANNAPGAFAAVAFDEAVHRLVRVIRAERPHVVLTYPEQRGRYRHPDHVRVHEASVAAFDAAGDPGAFVDAGEPWEPSKLYYSVWSKARIRLAHAAFEELGVESPFDDRWLRGRGLDDSITTTIDVAAFYGARNAALRAHQSQVDPTSRFWFGLPDDVARRVYCGEDWILARSRVSSDLPETDLFSGIHGGTEAT